MRVLDNRVLKKLFGSKMDEVMGERRRLRNEELYDLCSSTSIMRVIKSRSMRWVGHVSRMGERRIAYRVEFGGENLKTKDHLKDLDVNGRIIL